MNRKEGGSGKDRKKRRGGAHQKRNATCSSNQQGPLLTTKSEADGQGTSWMKDEEEEEQLEPLPSLSSPPPDRAPNFSFIFLNPRPPNSAKTRRKRERLAVMKGGKTPLDYWCFFGWNDNKYIHTVVCLCVCVYYCHLLSLSLPWVVMVFSENQWAIIFLLGHHCYPTLSTHKQSSQLASPQPQQTDTHVCSHIQARAQTPNW